MAAIGLAQVVLGARTSTTRGATEPAARAFLAQPRIAIVGLSTTETDFSRYVARALTSPATSATRNAHRNIIRPSARRMRARFGRSRTTRP